MDEREAAAFLRWEILPFVKVYGMDFVIKLDFFVMVDMLSKKRYSYNDYKS